MHRTQRERSHFLTCCWVLITSWVVCKKRRTFCYAAKHQVSPAFGLYMLAYLYSHHAALHSVLHVQLFVCNFNSCVVMTIDSSLHPGPFLTSPAHVSDAVTISCIQSLSAACSHCICVCKHLDCQLERSIGNPYELHPFWLFYWRVYILPSAEQSTCSLLSALCMAGPFTLQHCHIATNSVEFGFGIIFLRICDVQCRSRRLSCCLNADAATPAGDAAIDIASLAQGRSQCAWGFVCMVMFVHTLCFLVPSAWSCVTEFLWPGSQSVFWSSSAMLLCRCDSWCQSQICQHQLACFAVNVCCCTFRHACNLQLICEQDSGGLSQSKWWKLRQMTYPSNNLMCQETSMDSCAWTVLRSFWLAPDKYWSALAMAILHAKMAGLWTATVPFPSSSMSPQNQVGGL